MENEEQRQAYQRGEGDNVPAEKDSQTGGGSDETVDDQYELSKMRFMQMGLYVMSDLSNSLCIYSFQTIAAQVSKIYDLDPFVVSLNLSFYSVLYPIVSMFGNYIIDSKGAAFSIRCGLILTGIGSLIRLFIYKSWGYVLLSCFLCGAGGPLIFNSKCRFQSHWFRANDLPQVTTISTILTSCNSIIGVLLPGFFFADYEYKNDTSPNYQQGRDKLQQLLYIEGIIILICILAGLVFLRDKPFAPPSFVSTMKREDYSVAIKSMLKNKSYVKLNIASMLLIGNTAALGALFSFAIQPFGFTSSDTTYCAAGMVVCGIIGSIINSYLLRKYKKFKETAVVLSIIMLINVILIASTLQLGNIILLLTFASLFGGGYQPLLSTMYEYACELVFPIGEGSAQGFIMGTSSIFGFLCITIFGAIVRGENQAQSYSMVICMCIFLAAGALLIHTSPFSANRLNTELRMSSVFPSANTTIHSKTNTQTNMLSRGPQMNISLPPIDPDGRILQLQCSQEQGDEPQQTQGMMTIKEEAAEKAESK